MRPGQQTSFWVPSERVDPSFGLEQSELLACRNFRDVDTAGVLGADYKVKKKEREREVSEQMFSTLN